jgi:cyclopropane fatty-acyl-phospholipid synthase-like methyltransferase
MGLMESIDVLRTIFWMLRSNERDITSIYSYMAPIIQAANGGHMLNRGYWDDNTESPLEAQYRLCEVIGTFADFGSAQTLLDVGSGLSIPAFHWQAMYNFLAVICVDLNLNQLKVVNGSSGLHRTPSFATKNNRIFRVNATAKMLPLAPSSVDRIIALESHQHFRPFVDYIQECKRILKYNGLLTIATPVKTIQINRLTDLMKFGILSLTWSSQNFMLPTIKSSIRNCKFQIQEIRSIGSHVYAPLAGYYIRNRKMIRRDILSKYPPWIESLIFKSLLKSRDAYQKGLVDYVVIKCRPL